MDRKLIEPFNCFVVQYAPNFIASFSMHASFGPSQGALRCVPYLMTDTELVSMWKFSLLLVSTMPDHYYYYRLPEPIPGFGLHRSSFWKSINPLIRIINIGLSNN
jgi:hypothetical protein